MPQIKISPNYWNKCTDKEKEYILKYTSKYGLSRIKSFLSDVKKNFKNYKSIYGKGYVSLENNDIYLWSGIDTRIFQKIDDKYKHLAKENKIKKLKECVISKFSKGNKNILVKNRDRNYKPEIVIVRDYIKEKDLELCYYVDLQTGWLEGINSNGLALINSSLLVEYDEKEINIQRETNKISFEGKIILEALKQDNLNSFIKNLLLPNRLSGHTFINDKDSSYSLECMPKSEIHLNVLNNDIEVRTNHGHNIIKTGYIKGQAKISTTSRQIISKKELENLDNSQLSYEKILNSLSKDYINWDSKFQPNRNVVKEGNMYTTMQILFDTVNNVMMLRYNKDACKIKKIIDRRPQEIKKIKLTLLKDLV